MKKIRIGNDILVQWRLFVKGSEEPYNLEGKNISLYLKNALTQSKLENFKVTGNRIDWTFAGADQHQLGVYTLIISINEGKPAMLTTDVCNFVQLVPYSSCAGGNDDNGVATEVVEVASHIELGASESSYDDTELREAIEDLDYRVLAHSEDIVNLQENKADKSELTELSAEVGKKQDTITDLETIRSGAAKGATALQSVPATYATKTDVSNAIQSAITNELNADF